MQTDLGSQIDTVTASFVYAVRYGYSDTVINNDNQLRIFPREGDGQLETETSIWSIPQGRGVDFKDRFGNRVRRLRVIEPHNTFIVAAAGTLRLVTERPLELDVPLATVSNMPEAFEYANLSPLVDPETVSGAAACAADGANSLLSVVDRVIQWVYANIEYRRGITSVGTTAEQVLAAGEGVCQDKTHLALGMLRSLGIPCRYASGLIAGQQGETHSWVEFIHPGGRWLGADPTRGKMLPPPSDYVKLGVGRDYTDVSPVSGSFLSTGAAVDVAAIADVRLDGSQPTLSDALELLESAYVVQNDSGDISCPLERPEDYT